MQVCVVFTLGAAAAGQLFGPNLPPQHLAYVEWFTPFHPNPEPNHRMYKVSRACQDGSRIASIIYVSKIVRSIHLCLIMGAVIPCKLSSDTVLEHYNDFLINPFNVMDTYTLFHPLLD